MAKRVPGLPRPRTDISVSAIPSAIRKLKRRLEQARETKPGADRYGAASIIANKINATMEDIFGVGTAEAKEFHIDRLWFVSMAGPLREQRQIEIFIGGRDRAIAVVQAAIERLEEKLADGDGDASGRTLRAYEGLDLHPEIALAANDLYRNGHYANAIEDAVKALNNLVRLRSGEDVDGTSLMEKVFSPKNPILRFNEGRDESDQNEQKGFMMMFSGAVAGLRNPRAHRLIKDDPERALEFIAFVSLLAKLLDGTKK